MDLALITIEKIIEMFLIMLAGMAAWKFGILDSEAGKKLSGLLLKVISPAMIIISYQMEFQPDLLKGLLGAIILSAASFAAAILLSAIALKGKGHRDTEIEKMAVIYSNCAFIGIPLVNGLLGQEGVFYMTAYLTVYNVFVWSHGVALMSRTGSIKNTLKNCIQPANIAIIIGLCFFLLHIKLPAVLLEPLTSIGDMNTPLAMIVAGISLAESHLLDALKKPRTYWICLLKLAVVPILTLIILKLSGLTGAAALAVMIGSSCPTGAMGTMFALQYRKNSTYASELFAISTVLSLITIPCMILAGSSIF